MVPLTGAGRPAYSAPALFVALYALFGRIMRPHLSLRSAKFIYPEGAAHVACRAAASEQTKEAREEWSSKLQAEASRREATEGVSIHKGRPLLGAAATRRAT